MSMSVRTGLGAKLGQLFAAGLLLAAGVAVGANAPQGVAGTWQGKLGGALRLTLILSKASDGALSGHLVSVDQGGQKLPAQDITFKDQTLHLSVPMIKGEYVGKLNSAGDQLAGTWTQNGQAMPLDFKRGDQVPVVHRPQEPKKPYPYKEEEVLYPNAKAGIEIGGTLTLPKGTGPFPAVLLITGSGAQNRNEELLGHKPFLVLSDYLTRRGIAVLRVDDRGVGTSTGDFAKSTSADFATDVLAGVAFLKSRADIQHSRIGLIGHSEGGLIAPMVAAQSPDVAFIVLMAGPGVSGAAILAEQQALILKAGGTPETELRANDEAMKKTFAVLHEEPDAAKARPRLIQINKDYAATLPADKRAEYEKSLDQAVDAMNGAWMRYFLTYDPAPTLRKVTCPVLALFGELDLQVPPKQNEPPMAAAFKAGKNPDYTVRVLPGLNHLFQHAKTGAPTEYASIEETINPAALQLMGDWIAAHTQTK